LKNQNLYMKRSSLKAVFIRIGAGPGWIIIFRSINKFPGSA